MNLDDVFSALADGSRRRLIARLAHGPATTGQLADLLPISRPAVSQHVRLLQLAGLIGTEPVGRHRWHQLHPEPLLAAGQWAYEMAGHHAKSPTPRRRSESR